MDKHELVCTLTTADYRDRETAWLKLADFIESSGPIPGGLGIRFAVARGIAESLTELVRLEAECCAWMAFSMSESPQGIGLSITADGQDGERAVRETFAPLVRRSGLD